MTLQDPRKAQNGIADENSRHKMLHLQKTTQCSSSFLRAVLQFLLDPKAVLKDTKRVQCSAVHFLTLLLFEPKFDIISEMVIFQIQNQTFIQSFFKISSKGKYGSFASRLMRINFANMCGRFYT